MAPEFLESPHLQDTQSTEILLSFDLQGPDDLHSGDLRVIPEFTYRYEVQAEEVLGIKIADNPITPFFRVRQPAGLTISEFTASTSNLTQGVELSEEDLVLNVVFYNSGDASLTVNPETTSNELQSAIIIAGFDNGDLLQTAGPEDVFTLQGGGTRRFEWQVRGDVPEYSPVTIAPEFSATEQRGDPDDPDDDEIYYETTELTLNTYPIRNISVTNWEHLQVVEGEVDRRITVELEFDSGTPLDQVHLELLDSRTEQSLSDTLVEGPLFLDPDEQFSRTIPFHIQADVMIDGERDHGFLLRWDAVSLFSPQGLAHDSTSSPLTQFQVYYPSSLTMPLLAYQGAPPVRESELPDRHLSGQLRNERDGEEILSCSPLLVLANSVEVSFSQNGEPLDGWRWDNNQPDTDEYLATHGSSTPFLIDITRIGRGFGDVDYHVSWQALEVYSEVERSVTDSGSFTVYDWPTNPDSCEINFVYNNISNPENRFNWGDTLELFSSFSMVNNFAEPALNLNFTIGSPRLQNTITHSHQEILEPGNEITWGNELFFEENQTGFNMQHPGELDEYATTVFVRLDSLLGAYSGRWYRVQGVQHTRELVLEQKAMIHPVIGCIPTPQRPDSISLHTGAICTLVVQIENLGESSLDTTDARYQLDLPPDTYFLDGGTQTRQIPLHYNAQTRVYTDSIPIQINSDNVIWDFAEMTIPILPRDQNNGLEVEVSALDENRLFLRAMGHGIVMQEPIVNPNYNEGHVSTGQATQIRFPFLDYEIEIVNTARVIVALIESDNRNLVTPDTIEIYLNQPPEGALQRPIQIADSTIADSIQVEILVAIEVQYADPTFATETVDSISFGSFVVHQKPTLMLDALHFVGRDSSRSQNRFSLNQFFSAEVTMSVPDPNLINPQDTKIQVEYPWGITKQFENPHYGDNPNLLDSLVATQLLDGGEVIFRIIDPPIDINTGSPLQSDNSWDALGFSVGAIPNVRLIIEFPEGSVIGGDSLLVRARLINNGGPVDETGVNFQLESESNLFEQHSLHVTFDADTLAKVDTRIANNHIALIDFQCNPITDMFSGVEYPVTTSVVELEVIGAPKPTFAEEILVTLDDEVNVHYQASLQISNETAAPFNIDFNPDAFQYSIDENYIEVDSLASSIPFYRIIHQSPEKLARIRTILPGETVRYSQTIELYPRLSVDRSNFEAHLENQYIGYSFGNGLSDSSELESNSPPLDIRAPYPRSAFMFEAKTELEQGDQFALAFSSPMDTSNTRLERLKLFCVEQPLFINKGDQQQNVFVDTSSVSWTHYPGISEPVLEVEKRNSGSMPLLNKGIPFDSTQPPFFDLNPFLPKGLLTSEAGTPLINLEESDAPILHVTPVPLGDDSSPSWSTPRRNALNDVTLWVRDDANNATNFSGVAPDAITVQYRRSGAGEEWIELPDDSIRFNMNLGQYADGYERDNLKISIPDSELDNSWLWLEIHDRSSNVVSDSFHIPAANSDRVVQHDLVFYPNPYDPTANDNRLFIQFDLPGSSQDFDVILSNINGKPLQVLIKDGIPEGDWISSNQQMGVRTSSGFYRHRYKIESTEIFDRIPNGLYPVHLIVGNSSKEIFLFSIMRGGL
ncbi:hypothetical protein K8I28_14795 [bacterium]|nr:hypothetical protein [bacterium]